MLPNWAMARCVMNTTNISKVIVRNNLIVFMKALLLENMKMIEKILLCLPQRSARHE
jgi:hypothetical protein